MGCSKVQKWVVAGVLVVAGCKGGDQAKQEPKPLVPAPVVEPPPVVKAEPPAPAPELPAVPALVIPDDYKGRMKLAHQLVKDDKLDDAEVVFDKASEAEPTRATPHIEIARLRLDAKDVAGARKHAEAAVELDGTSGAWNTLGRVELMDGDKLAAIAAFEKATEANPDNSFAWNNLGLVLSQLGRWDEAVAALERATGGDKPEPYMWNNLGQAYEHTDKLELARAAYRQGSQGGSKASEDSLARLEGVTSLGAKADPPEPPPAER
jgi:Flp pilus assembly protein TadD